MSITFIGIIMFLELVCAIGVIFGLLHEESFVRLENKAINGIKRVFHSARKGGAENG